MKAKATEGMQGFKRAVKAIFVRLISADFVAQSRIARHRAVHAALGKDLMGEIHALALDLSTP